MSAEQMIGLGDEKRELGNDADAIAVYEIVANCLRNGMKASEKALCAKARLLAGNVHYDRGSYDLALEEFIAGVKICEDCGDVALETLGRLYNNIGNVYSTFSDIETATRYYSKAYPLSGAAKDRKTMHKERTKDAGDGVDTYMSGFTRALIERRDGKHDASIARFKGLGRFAAAKDLPPEYVCYSYQELLVCAFLYVIWRQMRKLHTCYWNLYKVNRDFVASQAEMAGVCARRRRTRRRTAVSRRGGTARATLRMPTAAGSRKPSST